MFETIGIITIAYFSIALIIFLIITVQNRNSKDFWLVMFFAFWYSVVWFAPAIYHWNDGYKAVTKFIGKYI